MHNNWFFSWNLQIQLPKQDLRKVLSTCYPPMGRQRRDWALCHLYCGGWLHQVGILHLSWLGDTHCSFPGDTDYVYCLSQCRAMNFQTLPKGCSDISCIGNMLKGLKTRFSAFGTMSQGGQIAHGHGCLQHFYSPIFPSVICIVWYLLSFWIPEWFIKALLKPSTFGRKIILGQNPDTAEP